MATADRPIAEEPIRQELTSNEPMHDENINEGITQEEPAHKVQMLPVDLTFSKEQGSERQMLYAEQVFVKRVIPTKAVAVTKPPFEGQTSSEGPLLETSLEKQVASALLEELSRLIKPVSELASGVVVLEEPFTAPNTQLVVIEEERPIQIGAEPIWVYGV